MGWCRSSEERSSEQSENWNTEKQRERNRNRERGTERAVAADGFRRGEKKTDLISLQSGFILTLRYPPLDLITLLKALI